jgi:hypothetical protein
MNHERDRGARPTGEFAICAHQLATEPTLLSPDARQIRWLPASLGLLDTIRLTCG